MFLQSLLHSSRVLLSRYRRSRWLNKVSNLKIHRWFCSHCLVTWLLRLRYIAGHGPENNLWFSINSPGRVVSCYLRAGRAAKVLARAISTLDRLPASIALCNLWFEVNSDANIAAHLSIGFGANVNGRWKLTGFVELFTSMWWMISLDMLVISIVERCFRLNIITLFLWKR